MEDIFNPIVPFVREIPGGVYPNRMFVINGMVPHGAYRFQVNLKAGSYPGANIPFHLGVRFDENKVVRNTFQYNAWGVEEVNYGTPFYPGAPFELKILVEPAHYKIAVNGAHYAQYAHRLPIAEVRVMSIEESVTLTRVQMTMQGGGHGGMYPPAGMVGPPHGGPPHGGPPHGGPPRGGPPPPHHETRIRDPHVPLIVGIPGGMHPGKKIYISGKVPHHADRFAVNFKWGAAPNDSIAMHINPRFHDKVIVENTFSGGMWGPEERKPHHFPLDRKEDFGLDVECHSSHFEIRINGTSFTYNHRLMPIERINTLEITGDVKLHEIKF
jgi:hypothetical protein